MRAREDPSTCASVLKLLLTYPAVLEEIVFSTVTLLDFLRDYRTDMRVILSLCRALRTHCASVNQNRKKILPFVRVPSALDRVIAALSVSLDFQIKYNVCRDPYSDLDSEAEGEADGNKGDGERDNDGEDERVLSVSVFSREIANTIHRLLSEVSPASSPRFRHLQRLSSSISISSSSSNSDVSMQSLISAIVDASYLTRPNLAWSEELRETINRESARLNNEDNNVSNSSGRSRVNIRQLLEEMRELKRQYQKKYRTTRSRPFLAFLRRK